MFSGAESALGAVPTCVRCCSLGCPGSAMTITARPVHDANGGGADADSLAGHKPHAFDAREVATSTDGSMFTVDNLRIACTLHAMLQHIIHYPR